MLISFLVIVMMVLIVAMGVIAKYSSSNKNSSQNLSHEVRTPSVNLQIPRCILRSSSTAGKISMTMTLVFWQKRSDGSGGVG